MSGTSISARGDLRAIAMRRAAASAHTPEPRSKIAGCGVFRGGPLAVDCGASCRPHTLRRKRPAAATASPEAKQPARVSAGRRSRLDGLTLFSDLKTLCAQRAFEAADITPARATDPDLRAPCTMPLDELRQQFGVPALVKDVAADNDIEAAEIGCRLIPTKIDEIDRR